MHFECLRLLFLSTIYCIAYLHLPGAHCETYEDFIATTLPTMCPYNTFCTMGPTKKLKSKKYSPCCKPCSCGTDCLLTGNCCPDHPAALLPSPPPSPVAQCSVPIHEGYDGIEEDVTRYPGGFQFYYFTATCPKTYRDQSVIRKCQHPASLELRDRVMVTDKDGRVFGNRYCAECNSVQPAGRWNMQLICDKFTNQLTNAKNFQQLSGNKCMVVSAPPLQDVAMTSRCYPVRFDKCNVTGRWSTYDVHVERACNATTSPYVEERLLLSDIYASPYCARCNEGADYAVTDKCQLDKFDRRDGAFSTPFVAMLHTPTGQSSRTPGKTDKCYPSEIYDPHFDKCRPLECPVASFPLDGKCVPAFQEAVGLVIYIQIDASYGNADTQEYFDTTASTSQADQLDNVATQIAEDIGIREHKCSTCQSRVLFRSDASGLDFLLGSMTTAQCPPSRLIGILNQWRLNPKSVSIIVAKRRLTFSVQLAYNVQEMVVGVNQRFKRSLVLWPLLESCNAGQVFLKPMFYCACLDINNNDYTNILSSADRHVDPSDFVAVGNGGNADILNGTSYRICVDRYLPKPSAGVGPGSTLVAKWVVFMVVSDLTESWL